MESEGKQWPAVTPCWLDWRACYLRVRDQANGFITAQDRGSPAVNTPASVPTSHLTPQLCHTLARTHKTQDRIIPPCSCTLPSIYLLATLTTKQSLSLNLTYWPANQESACIFPLLRLKLPSQQYWWTSVPKNSYTISRRSMHKKIEFTVLLVHSTLPKSYAILWCWYSVENRDGECVVLLIPLEHIKQLYLLATIVTFST